MQNLLSSSCLVRLLHPPCWHNPEHNINNRLWLFSTLRLFLSDWVNKWLNGDDTFVLRTSIYIRLISFFIYSWSLISGWCYSRLVLFTRENAMWSVMRTIRDLIDEWGFEDRQCKLILIFALSGKFKFWKEDRLNSRAPYLIWAW